jgi:hypothetical protein
MLTFDRNRIKNILQTQIGRQMINTPDCLNFSMKEIRGSIDINAPVEKVWQVIMDFGSYPDWNPWIRQMMGENKVGSKVKVVSQSPGRKAVRFTTEVREVEQNQAALLKGTLARGLLVDDHLLRFEPIGENNTRFSQSIVFRGIATPFISGIIRDGQKGLDQMNEAAKKECEKG